MPLQNRVRPDGELIATASRGSLMGNRGGRIHDTAERVLERRRWTSRRWICCALAFKGRQRTVWGPGYTELFFLDEATALAAGHRPCYECRRTEATAFARAVARDDGASAPPTADELDRRLHRERLDGRAKRVDELPFASLPDGAFVLLDGSFYAIGADELRLWSPAGYVSSIARPRDGTARVLTPPTILGALRGGYRPGSVCAT